MKKGEETMAEKEHLYILWTNSDPVTAEKMVFMYGFNAFKRGWWKNVTIIVWGATPLLVSENEAIQKGIRDMLSAGVAVSACKACADQLGVTKDLEAIGIEVKYWGEPLTEVLRNDEKLLTI
jgi:hypothetical protein